MKPDPCPPVHPRVKDITGQVFGRLTVVGFADYLWYGARRFPRWKCRCTCATETVVLGGNLRRGISRSCGCLSREVRVRRATRHGQSRKGAWSPEYRAWAGIKRRTLNPSDAAWKNYGGRGITVCERWRNSFEAFLHDMGPRPTSEHSVERKDVNGHYEPGNCRWATRAEQSRNRRDNSFYTLNGETLCLEDWAERLGMNPSTLVLRLQRWPVERALTEPLRPHKPYKHKPSPLMLEAA